MHRILLIWERVSDEVKLYDLTVDDKVFKMLKACNGKFLGSVNLRKEPEHDLLKFCAAVLPVDEQDPEGPREWMGIWVDKEVQTPWVPDGKLDAVFIMGEMA